MKYVLAFLFLILTLSVYTPNPTLYKRKEVIDIIIKGS
jgi:hypothetical protein